jgi:hypothetical protein
MRFMALLSCERPFLSTAIFQTWDMGVYAILLAGREPVPEPPAAPGGVCDGPCCPGSRVSRGRGFVPAGKPFRCGRQNKRFESRAKPTTYFALK